MKGEKYNLLSHSVTSTLVQNNNNNSKAFKKSTLDVEHRAHLRTRFDLQSSSLHPLRAFLNDKDNGK